LTQVVPSLSGLSKPAGLKNRHDAKNAKARQQNFLLVRL
jgi:hypothetical protein